MKKILIGALVVLGIVAYQALFVVQEINQAIVLQFGDPKKIITKPGLNYKIPFIQNVVYLDRRVLNLDNPPEEVIAADQKRLIVDAIARFKIGMYEENFDIYDLMIELKKEKSIQKLMDEIKHYINLINK